MTTAFEDLFVYATIVSPALIACLYPGLKMIPKLGSPYVALPAVGSLSAFLFLTRQLNIHFLIEGTLMLGCYLLLISEGKYSGLQALVMGALMAIALDQIWQIPFYVSYWPIFFYMLRTAAWELMAFPVLFYFLFKFNGRISLSGSGRKALAFCIALTVADVGVWTPGDRLLVWWDPYFLVFAWFVFFVILFRSSALNQGGLK